MKFRCFRALFLGLIFFGLRGADLQAFSYHHSSPASLARAGADIAVADDSSALYSNVAGLSRLQNERAIAISTRFLERFHDFGLITSVVDGKTEDPLAWGFLLNVTRTREEKFQDYILGTSYNLNHYLLFGLQTKLTNFNHARVTQDFFLFSMNAGVLAFLGDYIGVGLKMENFLRSKSRGSVAPYILGTGASFNHRLFRLAGDFERDFSNKAIRLKAGLDWAVVEWLNLKGGYEQLKGSGETQNSVAGGFSWKWARNTDFDLAFLDRLDSSFYVWSVGLALKF